MIKFSPYNANESKDEACVKCDCVKEWLSSHQSRTIILFDTRGKYLSKLLNVGVGHNSKEMKAIFSCLVIPTLKYSLIIFQDATIFVIFT